MNRAQRRALTARLRRAGTAAGALGALAFGVPALAGLVLLEPDGGGEGGGEGGEGGGGEGGQGATGEGSEGGEGATGEGGEGGEGGEPPKLKPGELSAEQQAAVDRLIADRITRDRQTREREEQQRRERESLPELDRLKAEVADGSAVAEARAGVATQLAAQLAAVQAGVPADKAARFVRAAMDLDGVELDDRHVPDQAELSKRARDGIKEWPEFLAAGSTNGAGDAGRSSGDHDGSGGDRQPATTLTDAVMGRYKS